MRIYECADYRAMSRRAASLIAAQVVLKPEGVLGLATGSTPIGLYSQLVEWYKQGDLSFAGIRSVNLDEYLGLAPTHRQSYRYFMQKHLFDHIDIKRENTHVLNGMAPDPEAECAAYNELIRSLGGIDLQLLGVDHHAVHIQHRQIASRRGDAEDLLVHIQGGDLLPVRVHGHQPAHAAGPVAVQQQGGKAVPVQVVFQQIAAAI